MNIKKNHRLLLGAHMSIAQGFDQAIAQAVSLDCTTLQIFTKSNRQWYAKELNIQQAQVFAETQKKSAIASVVAHASYLINIGSPDEQTRAKSIEALLIELERCSMLSIPYLVVHPGSHVKTDQILCLNSIAQSLNKVFEQYSGDTMILLETMSGQGSTMCYALEQLSWILEHVVDKKRIGVCVDTCHIFAAGYDISTKQGYGAFWQQYDEILGLNTLRLIHVNDSKKPCGSRVDRHEHIGQGAIGILAFTLLMNDPKFFDVPKILETPLDEKGDFAMNLKTLKYLLSKETKELLNYKQDE